LEYCFINPKNGKLMERYKVTQACSVISTNYQRLSANFRGSEDFDFIRDITSEAIKTITELKDLLDPTTSNDEEEEDSEASLLLMQKPDEISKLMDEINEDEFS